MLKLNYFLADIFILSAEKQPIKFSWRKIECLHFSKSSILDGKYLNINSVLINRLRRYVLPYFSYSIVLYILFQQEPVIKNLVRVLFYKYKLYVEEFSTYNC